MLWATFVERANEWGYARACVTDAQPFDAWRQALLARADDYPVRVYADPQELLPGARRIIVLAYPYVDGDMIAPGMHVSAYYAASQAAHSKLISLAKLLEGFGARVAAHPRLPAKAAAQRAGMGEYGRNGLLYVPGFGSRVVLHLLLTDACLPLTPTLQSSESLVCGNCDACIRVCPSNALGGNADVDTARCLRAYMLDGRIVPEPLRPLMGDRLLGCEVCQRVCPRNAVENPNAFVTVPSPVSLAAVLGMGEGLTPALHTLGGMVGTNYARRQRVQIQAALLAGNSGDARYAQAIRHLCGHPHEALSAHARWALARLDG